MFSDDFSDEPTLPDLLPHQQSQVELQLPQSELEKWGWANLPDFIRWCHGKDAAE